jgi:hypothetical protein
MPIKNTVSNRLFGQTAVVASVVTTISGFINQEISTTLTVNGRNFIPGSTVVISGAGVSNVARNLATTFISSTQITANTNAASVSYVGGATFNAFVTTPGIGTSNILLNAGTIDRTPAWSTASGSLGTIVEGNNINVTLNASDPDGTAIAYSLVSGAFTGTVALNPSTGNISGNVGTVASDTTVNFTIRATGGNSFSVDRAFSYVIQDAMTIASSSTSGQNNNFTSASATNNEIQRQGSHRTKSITINGAGFRSGATVTLGGSACTSVSVVNSTTITCTSPAVTFSSGVSLTLTVTNGVTGQVVNSPNTIFTRRFGESAAWPTDSGNTVQNQGDSQNANCTTYFFRRNNASDYNTWICGSNFDGGGWDYWIITGGTNFNYYNQGNSCPSGFQIWAPRSQGNYQGSHSIWGWRSATGNGGITYVYKPGGGGNFTGRPMRQDSFYGFGWNDWRVIDGGRWWMANDTHSEPNGDYDGFGNLQQYGQSGFPMRHNDGGAYGSGGEYMCSTNAKG